MGKRGRTGVAESGNNIADSILPLYDLAGFLADGTDHEAPRRTLVRALRQLTVLLEHIGSQDSRASSTAVSHLVQVEQLLRELRHDLIPAAVASNEFDSEQALLLRDDLEAAAASSWHLDGDPSCWSRVVLGFSLAASLILQLNEERASISELEVTIDTMFLYDHEGPRADRATRFIRDTVNMLERRSLLENRRYLEEMEGLVAEKQDQSVDEWQCAPPMLITGSRFCAHRERERFHKYVLSESSLEGTVMTFLQAPVHELAPVTALLVVGDHGSGKTHLCEKIEREAKAARCAGEYTVIAACLPRCTVLLVVMGASLICVVPNTRISRSTERSPRLFGKDRWCRRGPRRIPVRSLRGAPRKDYIGRR
jgi:hypothetical protein